MDTDSNGPDTIPVVLTIDTEPDDAWTDHLNPSVANVRELLRLQKLLDRYGAKATCLITYRMVQNDEAVDILQELASRGGAEIATHLHPWETPPFMDNGLDVKYHTYPHELPLEVFERKLDTLTEAITRRFPKPTSYRAGRWGLAAEHIPVLERQGYSVDTSVTPLIDWRENMGLPRSESGQGGIDYRRAPQCPYHPDYTDVMRPGGARLVEMPVTVGFTRRTPTPIRRKYGRIPYFFQRVLRKTEILRPVWAFPTEEPKGRLARMIDTELRASPALINIAFHSSELMLDGSPVTRTHEQVDEVFQRIELLLNALATHDACVFLTLTAASRVWSRAGAGVLA